MKQRRVVVTGMGVLSPIGNGPAAILRALQTGISGVRAMPIWGSRKDLHTGVAALVDDVDEKTIAGSGLTTLE